MDRDAVLLFLSLLAIGAQIAVLAALVCVVGGRRAALPDLNEIRRRPR